MTGELTSLRGKTFAAPIPVNLPNRGKVVASMEGNTSLSSKINLDKVIYVPHFSCNLVSVAQLIRDIHSIVMFDENFCII